MGADVRPLEAGPIVDADTHAPRGAEHLDQPRVGLEVLPGAETAPAAKGTATRGFGTSK